MVGLYMNECLRILGPLGWVAIRIHPCLSLAPNRMFHRTLSTRCALLSKDALVRSLSMTIGGTTGRWCWRVPLLTRLFSPEPFGRFGMYLGVVGFGGSAR